MLEISKSPTTKTEVQPSISPTTDTAETTDTVETVKQTEELETEENWRYCQQFCFIVRRGMGSFVLLSSTTAIILVWLIY